VNLIPQQEQYLMVRVSLICLVLCPLCEEEVDNYDDLLFDFIAEINQAIEFI
jgi:hypothetical protein